MELIAVVLGSKTSVERFESAKNLLNYGFGAYTLVDAQPAAPIPAVPVHMGTQEQVQLEGVKSCRVLVKREQAEQVETKVELPEEAEAPVEQGQKLGRMTISVGGERVKTIPLTAAESVERQSLGMVWRRLCSRMALGA
jgi:D-alanyl-D-alanine carboxypeptidase (penicillin-binding protein 5/6)